jgi:hypothetical protein
VTRAGAWRGLAFILSASLGGPTPDNLALPRFKLAENNARTFVASGSPYICWNRETLDRLGRGTMESASMSLLTTSIESTRLTRWNFGLGALTLLGIFAIALALILPDSITP